MTETYVSTRTVINAGNPVADVVIRLYDDVGAYITSATTNAGGLAYLGDRAEATYEIRISAPAPGTVAVNTVQNIVVPDSPDDYVFDVVVTNDALPVATDTHMCRCTGYFKDSHGRPAANVTLMFSEAATVPALLYYSAGNTSQAVVPTNTQVSTDRNGYASIDLIRTVDYQVFMEGYGNISRVIRIPDLTSAPLPDVIFPFVDRIEWLDALAVIMPTTAPTLTVSVGVPYELTVQTVFRSGLIVAGILEVIATTDDADVLSISVSGGDVTITGVAVGTANVALTRIVPIAGSGIIIYPEPAIVGTLAVTVDP